MDEREHSKESSGASGSNLGAERRRHVRKNAFWKGGIQTKHSTQECRSRNVSVSGALLSAAQQIPSGQLAIVQLTAVIEGKSRVLKFKSKVVRSSFANGGYHIAVNFIDPDPLDIVFVANYCENKSVR